MSTTANYSATPNSGVGCIISAANIMRDGTGTTSLFLTAGANGSRIDALTIKAQAATTSGMIRLFLHNGSVASLLTEIPVSAVVPGASTPSFEASVNANSNINFPIVLKAGFSLRASTHNAETFNIIPTQAGDF